MTNRGKYGGETYLVLEPTHTSLVQEKRTKWHDRFIKNKVFQKGDWALFFDSKFKDFKEKFTSH